jgi:hypothetical protein
MLSFFNLEVIGTSEVFLLLLILGFPVAIVYLVYRVTKSKGSNLK